MKRTQIYLTPAQHGYLKNQAQTNNSSLSAEVRSAIDFARRKLDQVNIEPAEQTVSEWILELADKAQELTARDAPTDASQHIDEIVYGELDEK